MASNVEKLQQLLEELFQLDQADLDFGIYRIMNQKRDEVVHFLEQDLLPQVQDAFGQYESADKAEVQQELDKLVGSITRAGLNPDASPKVQEWRQRLADASVEVTALENEVFSHLYNFFRRYYHEGDFISLRRYKEGVYAIPYEGEEVKLHWANHDQYYVKSSEYFRDYTFKVPSGQRVRVHVVAASTEQDNNKAAPGKERRFFLCAEHPLEEQDGELFVRFEYRPAENSEKQDDLNKQAIEHILNEPGFEAWKHELARLAPTEKKRDRTVLEKHLTQYTARNTFDYFIHKDLGGFLRRELDFYIKNEVMHLDDIDHESAPRVEQYLSKIKVIRRIAHKIIQFLEQLENYQKKLWLKKKFVVETNYCITLDRVPEELYPEIAANDAQREEWVRLFAIDEIEEDLTQPGYTMPLKLELLHAHPMLLLDTRFYSTDFKNRLLASIDSLDNTFDGILIHSDNFQALRLLLARFQHRVKCIYSDPPYNTGSSSILYKNSYRHSSWCTMIYDRLDTLKSLLTDDGVIFVSIDKTECTILEHAMDVVFGEDNHIEELIWTQNTANSQLPNYSTNHEYVEVYSRDRASVERSSKMFREPKPGYAEIMEQVERLNPEYPPIKVVESEIKRLFVEHIATYREELEANGQEWNAETKKQDPWRGIYNYCRAEYRDRNGKFVPEAEARDVQAVLWVWREISPSAPASKQASSTKNPKHFNYRYYRPLHPVTGKPCPHPKGGWKFPLDPDPRNPARRSFTELQHDNRIAWGEDEMKVPQTKGFLHEVATNIGTSVFYEYNDGESEVAEMFGESGIFLSPKSSRFVRRFVAQTTSEADYVVDCFGGSGSSGHAVISQNREAGGNRKYVLVEMGHHFDTVMKPRIQKAIYAVEWKEGKPNTKSNRSHGFKYCRLESYEDSLNNIRPLTRTDQQTRLFDANEQLREEYTLSYMLDVESRGSPSLLNIDNFRNPDQYKLRVERNGETQLVNVDLVETFNWLLGLTVKHIDVIRGVRVVEGTNPEGERVLVLWRNLDETDNDVLDQWFEKQDYNTRDQENDLIYVNGDNNLENLRRPGQTWKVRLIEEEFQRLMFDVQDV